MTGPVLPTMVGAVTTALVAAAGTTKSEPVVSPGMAGFLVTLAVVLACIPLFRSMVRKIRGVQYRDAGGPAEADASEGGPPVTEGLGAEPPVDDAGAPPAGP